MMTASKGKALITGATTRMGAIYAERLARRGHDLILVAPDTEGLAVIAERIERETGRCVAALTADLADELDLAALEAGVRNTPGITMLVEASPKGAGGSTLGAAAAKRLADTASTCFSERGRGTVITMRSAAFVASPETTVDHALAGLDRGTPLAIVGWGDGRYAARVTTAHHAMPPTGGAPARAILDAVA